MKWIKRGEKGDSLPELINPVQSVAHLPSAVEAISLKNPTQSFDELMFADRNERDGGPTPSLRSYATPILWHMTYFFSQSPSKALVYRHKVIGMRLAVNAIL